MPGRRRRGRGRCARRVSCIPPVSDFQPFGVPAQEVHTIFLKVEEAEAVRLVDLEGMDQEMAAMEMGISRKSLWNDLKSARKKIADALLNGHAIRIEGGTYILSDRPYVRGNLDMNDNDRGSEQDEQ